MVICVKKASLIFLIVSVNLLQSYLNRVLIYASCPTLTFSDQPPRQNLLPEERWPEYLPSLIIELYRKLGTLFAGETRSVRTIIANNHVFVQELVNDRFSSYESFSRLLEEVKSRSPDTVPLNAKEFAAIPALKSFAIY